MRRRKLALLMAMVMTLTSVYPGGAVFAEDTVVPETAIEAAAEEAPEAEPVAEDVSADLSADIDESPDAQADTAAEQVSMLEDVSDAMEALPEESAEAADEGTADEWDEPLGETIVDEDYVPIDAEDLPGDVTAAELVDEDGDFIVDISAVDGIEPMSEPEPARLEVESVTGFKLEGEYAPVNVAPALYEAVKGLTVNYVGESFENILSWDTSYYGEDDYESIVGRTENGNHVEIRLKKDGNDFDIPSRTEVLQIGEYSVSVYVDGAEMEGSAQTFRVTEEALNAIGTLPESFALENGQICSYSVAVQESSKLILNITSDKDYMNGSDFSYALYKEENGEIVRESRDEFWAGEQIIPINAGNTGKNYWILLSNNSGYPANVETSIEKKLEVKAVTGFDLNSEYSVVEAVDALWSTVKGITLEYTDDTASEKIKSLKRVSYTDGDENNSVKCIAATTQNSDTVQLRLQKKEAEGDVFKYVNVPKRNHKLAKGEYKALIYVNDTLWVEKQFTAITPAETEIPNLAGSFELKAKGTCYYAATVSALMNLCLDFVPQSGESVSGGKFKVFLYKKNETGGIVRSGNGRTCYTGENILPIGGPEEAEQQYWIKIKNKSKHDVTVTATLKEKLTIGEVTGLTLEESYSSLKAADALYAVANGLKVRYTNDTEEPALNWGTSDESLLAKTSNGDIVDLYLQKDGEYIEFPRKGSLMETGNYSVILYVNDEPFDDCRGTFVVTAGNPEEDLEAEELQPDKKMTITLASGEVKWLKFIPSEVGSYTIYSFNNNGDFYVELYDSQLNQLDNDDDGAGGNNFSLTYYFGAESGIQQAYYYKICAYEGDGGDARSTSVILTRPKTLTGAKVERTLNQDEFILGGGSYLDVFMNLEYDGGETETLWVGDGDSYGNTVHAWMYPVDASGNADMSQGSDWTTDCAPGKYLLVVGVCQRVTDEEGDYQYIAYEGEGFEQIKKTVSISKRKVVSSAALTLTGGGSYDPYEVGEEMMNSVRVELRFSEEEEPLVIDKWERDSYDGYDALAPAVYKGNNVYLTFWKDNKMVDVMQTYGFWSVPKGLLTLKLVIDEKVYNTEEATANITVDIPSEDAETLETGKTLEYSLVPGEHKWYTFTAAENAEYAVRAGTGNDGTSIHLFEEKDGFLYDLAGEYTNTCSFVAEADKKYQIVVCGQDNYSCGGELRVVKKQTLSSVVFADTSDASFDVAAMPDCLMDTEVKVTYKDDPSVLTIDSWSEDSVLTSTYGYIYALYHCTEKGDEILLTLWEGDALVQLPIYGNVNTLQPGIEYTLKLMVNGEVSEESVKKITLTQAEAEQIPLDKDLAVGAGKDKRFDIPAQDKNTILLAQTTNGGFVPATLYEVTSEGFRSIRQNSIYSEGVRYYLTKGKTYRLIVKNNTEKDVQIRFSMKDQLTVASVTGFAVIGGTYSAADALDAIRAAGAALSVNYTDKTSENVRYWYRNVTEVYSAADGYSYPAVLAGQETLNGNQLQIRLMKDGSYYSIPENEILDAGTYTVTLYVDGKEQEGCSASIIVTEQDLSKAEELTPDKSYTISVGAGESKWYRFKPAADGVYTIYSSQGDSAGISLYSDKMQKYNAYCDYWFYGNCLTYSMKGGETYYYKLGGQDGRAAAYTATLTEKKKLTGTRIKQEQSADKREFEQNVNIELDFSMTFVYEGGLEQDMMLYSNDQFGNYLGVWMYRIGEDGEPDRSKEYSLLAGNEVGTYRIEVYAISYDEKGNLQKHTGDGFENMSFDISIVPPKHEHQFKEETKDATCTEDGYRRNKCTVCGYVESSEIIWAKGHTVVGPTETKATCTSDGMRIWKCSVCGAITKSEVTEKATGHKKDAGTVTKAATCTTDGVKTYKCSVCGAAMGTETLKATGTHSWGAWTTVSEATVLAPEKQQRKCSKCGATETKDVGTKLTPKADVPATKASMKTGQKTSVFNVEMAEGDSIVSVESSDIKRVKVSGINKENGTFKLKAGKKTGKVKVTIKLASGAEKTIALTVQKKKVTTKKVKLTPKKLTLTKGEKYTLKPTLTPITTQDKVKYKSSNKKVAAVSGKGIITAKKAGKATITVTSGKKKVKCTITVK